MQLKIIEECFRAEFSIQHILGINDIKTMKKTGCATSAEDPIFYAIIHAKATTNSNLKHQHNKIKESNYMDKLCNKKPTTTCFLWEPLHSRHPK